MKKIIILSFALVCLFSCSSSDTSPIDSNPTTSDGGDNSGGNTGGNSTTKDPIIGTWTLFLGTDQAEVSDCLKKTTFTFNEDKSYTQVEFKKVNGSCDKVVDVAGEWKSKGNNIYELRRHGFTSGPSIEFKFEDDNKKMIVVRQTYKRK